MDEEPSEELLKICFNKLIAFNSNRNRVLSVNGVMAIIKAIQLPHMEQASKDEVIETINDLLKEITEVT